MAARGSAVLAAFALVLAACLRISGALEVRGAAPMSMSQNDVRFRWVNDLLPTARDTCVCLRCRPLDLGRRDVLVGSPKPAPDVRTLVASSQSCLCGVP